MNTVIIGIGSNIEAGKNITEMFEILEQKVKVLKVSPLIRTEPIGIKDQPDFINGAVKVATLLDQGELNKELKAIEDMMGRDRTQPKFGSRCIDLDIIVWNGKIVDPDYYSRNYLKENVDSVLYE